jgi:hypothetical protein
MQPENHNTNHHISENSQIYLHKNNQTFGPYEEATVRQWLQNGQCSPNDMACRYGMTQWQPLNTILSFAPTAPKQPTENFPQNPIYQVLNSNLFLIKQQVARLKASSSYDIYDPQSGQMLLECREDELGLATKVMRFSSKHGHRTPFDVKIKLPNGQTILRIMRGTAIVSANVSLFDVSGNIIGGFQQKLLGKLTKSLVILDANNQLLYDLRGDGLAWEFDFIAGNTIYAKIYRTTKTKQLLTSNADDYTVQIADSVPPNHPIRQFILAAAICADKIFNQ